MELLQSTPSASIFESDTTVEDPSWVDDEDISVRLTNDMNSKLWGVTPVEPTDMFGTILGFKMIDNVILIGAEELIQKSATWEDTHRIFKFFESVKQEKRSALEYAVLGLKYIMDLKLSRIQDITVLIGDDSLKFYRLNKAGILPLTGHIAIGNEIDIANVTIKNFPADKTYAEVEKVGRAARTEIMKNAVVVKSKICKSVSTHESCS